MDDQQAPSPGEHGDAEGRRGRERRHARYDHTQRRRDGGDPQRPLDTHAGDAAPGDAAGEGLNQFGAAWYVPSPHGNKVEKTGS
jgi:hypothetical protein